MSHYSRERKHKVDIFDAFKAEKLDNSYSTQQKNKGKKVKVVKEPIQLKPKATSIVDTLAASGYRWNTISYDYEQSSIQRLIQEMYTDSANIITGSPSVGVKLDKPEELKEPVRYLTSTDDDMQIGTMFPQDKAKSDMFVLGANKSSTILVLDHYLDIFKKRLALILENDTTEDRTYDLSSLEYKLNEHTSGLKVDFSALDSQKYHFYYSLNIKRTDNVLINLHGTREKVTRTISLVKFTMTETGNCCGSMTFYGLETSFHKRGLATIATKMIEDVATMQKCSNLMCINVKGRYFTDHLIKNDYKAISEFLNTNSTHICVIMSKNIKSKQFKGEPIILKQLEWAN